jgi:large subunit ribosomal protein L15
MTIQLHSLVKPAGARKPRTRVGRGESSGKGRTSGRGNKGQMSRSGHNRKPGFEGGQMRLIRRLPKRGFTGRNLLPYLVVNVGDLESFADGTVVTPELLESSGLVGGRGRGVKILGAGELKHKLTVKAHAFSVSARSKIEAAGGVCEVIGK